MTSLPLPKKGHFARECRSGRNQGKRSYGDNGRSNAPTNEYSSQALMAQDGLGGYDWSNDFEIEPDNYALMAISFQAHQVLLTMRYKNVLIQPTQTQGIDWNDPSVLRYHALKNKP
ncbi:hypothetical protein Tco_0234606, partial [Tanacetum coccineum]